MPRDRRRGRRPRHRHAPAKPGPVVQQPRQPVMASKQAPAEKASAFPRASSSAKQPVTGNPRLGKDLRNIGILAVALVVLLIVLSLFI